MAMEKLLDSSVLERRWQKEADCYYWNFGIVLVVALLLLWA